MILFLKILTLKLKRNHQKIAPRNTPETNINAVEGELAVLSKPNPANIATKFKMVVGFVIMRKRVDKYTLINPFPSKEAALSAGFARKIFTPK